MKAGNGIIHDENSPNHDPKQRANFIQGFQFWINSPVQTKLRKIRLIAVQANEIPKKHSNESGG